LKRSIRHLSYSCAECATADKNWPQIDADDR